MGITIEHVTKLVHSMLAPVRRRVQLVIARAVLRLVDDSQQVQYAQASIYADDVQDNLERFQNYGFSSVPHSDAEAVIAFVGGLRDHGIIIAVDDRRYRLHSMKAGEVAIYTDEGDKIHFRRGKIIDIEAGGQVNIKAGAAINIEAPAVSIKAGIVNIDQQ